jgi:hypothetical protein
MDVATDRLMRDAPLPDIGALRSELLTWASSAATSPATRKSSVFVRAFLATALAAAPEGEGYATTPVHRLLRLAMRAVLTQPRLPTQPGSPLPYRQTLQISARCAAEISPGN